MAVHTSVADAPRKSGGGCLWGPVMLQEANPAACARVLVATVGQESMNGAAQLVWLPLQDIDRLVSQGLC